LEIHRATSKPGIGIFGSFWLIWLFFSMVWLFS
jgi:hypothetical protein